MLDGQLRRVRKVWDDPRSAREAIEYTYINRLRFWLWRKALPLSGRWGHSRLGKAGALPAIDAYNAGRPANAFEPDWFDLWHLYRDVRAGRYQHCLEYGSGQSTLVIAKALHDNGRGHLTTLESEEEWATINREAMPAELRPFVTVLHSPRRVLSRLEIRFSHAPVAAPDFVYLDGPDHPAHNMASLDLVDLEPNFPRNFRLVVDGRTFNKNQLLRRFRRRYRSRWRSLVSNDTVITLR